MRYFLVFGTLFNKIVTAENKNEVKGKIIKEMTSEEVKEYASRFDDLPNYD